VTALKSGYLFTFAALKSGLLDGLSSVQGHGLKDRSRYQNGNLCRNFEMRATYPTCTLLKH